MNNKKGYILLECVISLSIMMGLSLSLYSLLFYSNNYKTIIEDKVEVREQARELTLYISKVIENSNGIISVRDLNGKTIQGDINNYTKVKSIKCKYRSQDVLNVKDKEISYKNNNKLFINTLNEYGSSEPGGYEIGDYVEYIQIKSSGNKINIKLSLEKNKERYELSFDSYIKDF